MKLVAASSERKAGVNHTNQVLLRKPVKPGTSKRYLDAVSYFRRWKRNNHYRPFTNIDQVDVVLNDYIHHCWRDGLPSTAKNAVYGIKHIHPSFKNILPISERAIKTWDETRAKNSYLPMPMSLAYCIAVYMMSKGKASMAIATVLAFHTFARGGEILQVRVCDVLDINDIRTCRKNAEMGVLLRDTKTGKN